jgi:hypothetical protein
MIEGMPDTDYLSATLELDESGRGEMRKLALSPCFDEPRMQLSIVEAVEDDEAVIALNRRQIECLADFLVAWLGRAK